MTTDFKRQIATYRATRGSFDVVDVPAMRFVMIDGHGDPNTSRVYADALESLYPVAFALKFLSRNELGRNYTVMPLEGLWWSEDLDAFTLARDKSQWDWTLLIMVPDWIDDEHFAVARSTVEAKGVAPALDHLRLETFDEGLAVQTLHVGSYDDEGPVLRAMHEEVIPGHGLRMTGKHHPRGVPQRSPPDRAGPAQDHPAPAGRAGGW